MNEKTWSFIDKSQWPVRGEWDREPDKVQWIDDATGLPCLALRNRSHWCGYVGVTEGHPAFQASYDDIRPSDGEDMDVHGGLTFADFCQEGEGDNRICHVPEPGQSDRVWWLGFDCAHGGDLRPPTNAVTLQIHQMYPLPKGTRETYRTIHYVQAECRKLAAQLKEMEIAK